MVRTSPFYSPVLTCGEPPSRLNTAEHWCRRLLRAQRHAGRRRPAPGPWAAGRRGVQSSAPLRAQVRRGRARQVASRHVRSRRPPPSRPVRRSRRPDLRRASRLNKGEPWCRNRSFGASVYSASERGRQRPTDVREPPASDTADTRDAGSTLTSPSLTAQCRCGPVTRPVAPAAPSRSPVVTIVPALTSMRDR